MALEPHVILPRRAVLDSADDRIGAAAVRLFRQCSDVDIAACRALQHRQERGQ
jgi:hypothetical protein